MQMGRFTVSRGKLALVGVAVLAVLLTLLVAPRNQAVPGIGSSGATSTPSGPPAPTSTPFGVMTNKEIGTWVWNPIAQMPTSTMQQIVDDAADSHFNAIYLSIDPYLNIYNLRAGAAKQAAFARFSNALYEFISIAHQRGIAVDAEAGEIDWGEPQYYWQPYAVMSFVQSFNATHDGKFRGVQFDVESYSLPDYATDPATVLADYVGLVRNLVSRDQAAAASSTASSSAPLPLTMIVPYFYSSDHGTVPKIVIGGVADYPFNHVVRALGALPAGSGRVMVLAYRNVVTGGGGSVALAGDEVRAADGTGVQVIVAQEAGDVSPRSITFFGMSKDDLYGATAAIDGAFANDASYGGIAVDYLQAFLALR
ncbi:MAG TPA: hypothetical protein VMT99_00700 [Candidatus Paceibacterota bacterium]|nr:hypothetical protein [Candidatus Paceibacterota bacterium]